MRDHRSGGEAFFFVRDAAGSRPAPPPAAAAAPWRLWEAVTVVVLFVASQVGLVLLVAGSLSLGGWSGGVRARADTLLALALPIAVFGSHAVGWAAALGLVSWRHGRPFAAALALGPYPAGRLLRPFAAGVGMQAAVLAAMLLLPPPADYEGTLERFFQLGLWARLLLVLMAGVMAPLLEEVLFRGLLLTAFRRRLGFVPAALAVTVLFTGLHVTQTGPYPPALGGIFLCGYALAWLRERHGSLWPPIVFHLGFNLAALLPLLLLGGAGAVPPP
ncbi:MAG: CPBP family intramembrane metalloprotease [Candidatus Lambdaproteobacteria bacterium]|nr:CPBP family intramembrane metalloprotease [Candidatus Lambdaproteobacteria bacterium]